MSHASCIPTPTLQLSLSLPEPLCIHTGWLTGFCYRQAGREGVPLTHTTITYVMGSGFPSSCPQGQITQPESTKELRPHGRTLAGQSRKTGRRQWINSSPFFFPTTTRFSISFLSLSSSSLLFKIFIYLIEGRAGAGGREEDKQTPC